MERVTELLTVGTQQLGLEMEGAQIATLETHLALLGRWNAKLNLVGPGAVETWAVQHTLDSLAVASWIQPGDSVVDVGSGAGFPGIPCAVACPSASFLLVEPRANRAAFLQNVLAAIQAKNAKVLAIRAEAVTDDFDWVLGRAVAAPEAWSEMASSLCAPGGAFALFALADPPPQLAGAERTRVRSYQLPGGVPRFVASYVPRGTKR